MKNGNKPWTIKEQEYLVKNRNLPILLLVKTLGRTKNAVWQKIGRLRKSEIIKYVKRKPRKANEIFQWEKRNTEIR